MILNKFYLIGLFFLCCLFCFACNKPEIQENTPTTEEPEKPTDYRDKYIGKYQVKRISSQSGGCGSYYKERDTVININYGLTDSTISFFESDIYLKPSGESYGIRFRLKLWNDSIYSLDEGNGSLGCRSRTEIKGFKIK